MEAGQPALIRADLDTTTQETLLRLLESAQSRDSDMNHHLNNDDAAAGPSNSDSSVTAMMLAERHAARQRQQSRANAIQRELEWDEADTRQRRHSLLSAVIGAGRPWRSITGNGGGGDPWDDFDSPDAQAGGDAEMSSDMEEAIAAMLEEGETDEDDDEEDEDDDEVEGEDDGFMSRGGIERDAFPLSSAEHHNALAAMLEIGGFAPATGLGRRDDHGEEGDYLHGVHHDDDDALMRAAEEEAAEEARFADSVRQGSDAMLRRLNASAASRRTAAQRLPSPRNEADIQRDLDALLQGRLLGTEPLNFSPRAGRPYAVSSSHPPRTNDPSSALSYTSFFRPGASFVGEQRFPSAHECSSHDVLAEMAAAADADGLTAADDVLQLDLRRWREAHGISSSSASSSGGGLAANRSAANSGAAPSRVSPWHSVDLFGRPASGHDAAYTTSSSNGDGNGMRVGRSETSPLLGLARARASHNRYAPYSAVANTNSAFPSSTSTAASSAAAPPHPQPGVPPALGAPTPTRAGGMGSLDSLAARAGVPAVVSVAVPNEVDQWPRAYQRMPAAGGPASASAPKEEERERWGVKVSIDTYDPVQRQLSGFMAAHGITVASRTDVPISAHSPTTKSDITTFFTGQILHPILDGLFTIPPVGRLNLAGWPCKPRLTRSHEADGWVQIGPFKGMKSGELLERGKDRQWVQEVSKGWILCRWKEKEFINVAAKDAPLSISGHYQVALDRRTGFLEGLYMDPYAAPQQRLVLSPAIDESGAIGFGSYAYR
ncbi:hypothetical protein JCM10908_001521 [Rhodotorula pacifica]|uniref:uncharacterized protein n=1 Tax=Rhodotorula pacifica TaxID=1495444 RepID=UPI00316EF5AE